MRNNQQESHSLHPSDFFPTWLLKFLSRKTQVFTLWVAVIFFLSSIRDFPNLIGIGIIFLGATLRFWSCGYIHKNVYLTVGGPYAFVRHPLYLGIYIMIMGALIAVESFWLLAFFNISFAIIYYLTIIKEERRLQTFFGGSYQKYCQLVPRFFPRIWPPFMPASLEQLSLINPEPSHARFSWSLAMKNNAFEAYYCFIGINVAIYLTAWIFKELHPI